MQSSKMCPADTDYLALEGVRAGFTACGVFCAGDDGMVGFLAGLLIVTCGLDCWL